MNAEIEITFDIQKRIGVIKKNGNGWNKELNIVAWNGGEAKFDIRDWDQSHERMSRGITLVEGGFFLRDNLNKS